jgi:hypothetical protein
VEKAYNREQEHSCRKALLKRYSPEQSPSLDR